MRSEPQLGGQSHPEGRSGAEDGGAVDAPGHLARVDGGAGGHHPGSPGARIPRLKTASSGPEVTTVTHWLRWSARHKWVSRSLARDEWIARTSDERDGVQTGAHHAGA